MLRSTTTGLGISQYRCWYIWRAVWTSLNNAYYFTGNSTNLAATGAYINVSVVGTTQFQMTSVPRLYRNTTTTIEARLLDNSLQPLRQAPVTWTWSYDGRSGVNYTDDLGTFSIPFDINPEDSLW